MTIGMRNDFDSAIANENPRKNIKGSPSIWGFHKPRDGRSKTEKNSETIDAFLAFSLQARLNAQI
jgi:hypothetical protein